MRRNKIRVYLHLVWATWDRQPFLTQSVERQAYRVIEDEVRSLNCKVIAIGGDDTHTHMLVNFPTTLTIAMLVQQAKGVSSRFINAELKPTISFKWQGCYGAFSIGHDELHEVVEYINNQRRHHAENLLRHDLERCDEEETDSVT